jgi:hypothetical protein
MVLEACWGGLVEHWGMVARWRATNIYRGDGAMSDQEGMVWWRRRKPRKGKVKVVFISITTTFSGCGCGCGCGAFKAGTAMVEAWGSNSSKLWRRRRRGKGWEKGTVLVDI